MDKITGHLSAVQSIKGIIKPTGYISGFLVLPQTVGGDPYDGDYIVTPLVKENVTLETKEKYMTDDVVVLKVPYYETTNVSGTTVYIGEG